MAAWIIISGLSLERLKKFVDEDIVKALHQRHFTLQTHPGDITVATNRFLKGLVDNLKNEMEWRKPYFDKIKSLNFFAIERA